MNELEQRWRDLGEFIREQRRIGHLSLRKLSEMAGISNPYLSQIERGLRKPSAEILQNIARALEISSETLYVRAGILEERDGEFDLVGEIRRDPALSEDQKKTLIHIYQSFAAETSAARGALTHAVLDVVETDGSSSLAVPETATAGPEAEATAAPGATAAETSTESVTESVTESETVDDATVDDAETSNDQPGHASGPEPVADASRNGRARVGGGESASAPGRS